MLIETDYRAMISAGQDGLPLNISGGVVAIGNFDGVHRGHQALLAEGKALAGVLNAPFIVLTFSPHPRLYFKPDQMPFLLSDDVLKRDYLTSCGVDGIVAMKFDAILSQVTAQEFVEHILLESLQAKHVMVGENFIFGHKRGGDVALLQKFGRERHFGVTAMPAVSDFGDNRISSERVREAIRHGHMASAEDLLGRPWMLRGEVIHGDKRGRTIGFPTINMSLNGFVRPLYGIYTATVTIEGTDQRYNAVMNVGIRPSFELPYPILEAHLLDFEGDLYGKMVRVAFGDFLRPELKFPDLLSLKTQIQKDVKIARQIFQERLQTT